MKILLFVISVYNTLDEVDNENYVKLIEILEKIRKKHSDDLVYISFCDNTKNKNVILYHIRNIIENIRDKQIYLGEQFLGDVHFKNIYGGSLLYKDGKLNKINEIINYVKILEYMGNEIELIVVDGNMNVKQYEKRLYDCNIDSFTLITGELSLNQINKNLENLCNIFAKTLIIEN